MPQIASRVRSLGTETALDVLVKARAVEARGRSVIHLEVGEPDFPTPMHIVEAGVRALRDGKTRYGAPAGLPSLREAICEDLNLRGVRALPDRVLVTPGAKPILFYGFLATLSPGDEVLVPDPGFPIYASMVRFCGAVPVSIPPRLAEGRALDLDALEQAITPRTRMVVFNSPSNPTGAIVPEADLRRLAALAERHDLWGLAALRGPQEVVSAMVEQFRKRRDAIVGRLGRIPGVRCHLPDGAFYAFPDVRGLPLPSAALADRLLEEEAVALLDGVGFGPGGTGHLRLSFASSLESLEEAADRFGRLVARL